MKSDPLNRTEKDTRLIQIKQGYEPSTFTSHFHGWDHSRWQVRFLYNTFHVIFVYDIYVVIQQLEPDLVADKTFMSH